MISNGMTSRRPWQTRVTSSLTSDDLVAVVEGSVPAIVVEDYLSAERVRLALKSLLTRDFSDYGGSERDTDLQRLGVARAEFLGGNGGKGAYFDAAVKATEELRGTFHECGDLVESLLGSLVRTWPGPVDVAAEPDQERHYSVGLVRLVKRALPHVDWPPADGGGWLVEQAEAQLAFNVFIRVQDTGGEVIVYRRPWTPDLEDHRTPGSYSYEHSALEGVDRVKLKPKAGDLVIFNSRNVHEVLPVDPNGDSRLALSAFGAVMPDSKALLLFS
jgi:hypothetical protein